MGFARTYEENTVKDTRMDKRMVKKFFQTPSSKFEGGGGPGGGLSRIFFFFSNEKIFFPKKFSDVFYTILYDLVLKTLRRELRQV